MNCFSLRNKAAITSPFGSEFWSAGARGILSAHLSLWKFLCKTLGGSCGKGHHYEEINYYVTCHLIFPTISYIYVVKRVILLAVIHTSLSVLVSLGLITLNSWSGIRHKKSCFQSRSSETSFGDSRGVSGLFNLPQSTDSIKSHLCLIHLSKESFTEGELIFARAGLFDVEDSVMAKCGSAQSIGTLMGSSGAKVQRASIRHTLVAIPKG